MLRPRVIPCLLIHQKGLVKSVKFDDYKYVGDPINAVKIFNEKEVDELIVLDIDATRENSEPDFDLIRKLAMECRMPFCYGGGVKTVEQAKKIVSLGAEKVAFSSEAIENPKLLIEVGKAIGMQSVVVVLDYKKKGVFRTLEAYTHNGTKSTGKKLLDLVGYFNTMRIGEIVINSIEHDGTMSGYDLTTLEKVHEICDIPLTILGGAGQINDLGDVIKNYGIIGVAAGSFFVFKGKYRAVLINYPKFAERLKLMK